MLETIREFALDRLAASGEEEQTRRRHADFFLALAERSEPEFYGPEQAESLALLTREHANLRAALAWTLEAGELDRPATGGGARPVLACWRPSRRTTALA